MIQTSFLNKQGGTGMSDTVERSLSSYSTNRARIELNHRPPKPQVYCSSDVIFANELVTFLAHM
jgi:hypothetical protein